MGTFGGGTRPGQDREPILGYLMYKSGLVPRRMAWFGLIGGPLRRSSARRGLSIRDIAPS